MLKKGLQFFKQLQLEANPIQTPIQLKLYGEDVLKKVRRK